VRSPTLTSNRYETPDVSRRMLTDLDSVSREKIHSETEREREITMERGTTTRGERDERVGTAVAPAIRDPMRDAFGMRRLRIPDCRFG